MRAAVSSKRWRWRRSSASQPATLKPKVIGNPCWPWVRPAITVSRCSPAEVAPSPRSPDRDRRSAMRARLAQRQHQPSVGDVLHGGAEINPFAARPGAPAAHGVDQPRRRVPGCFVTVPEFAEKVVVDLDRAGTSPECPGPPPPGSARTRPAPPPAAPASRASGAFAANRRNKARIAGVAQALP